MLVSFNDPVPIPDPAERAVKMAVAMLAGTLIADWRERGVCWLSSIFSSPCENREIAVVFCDLRGYTSQRVNVALKGSVATEQVGALDLKDLTQPVVAYNVPLATSQPALRVIEGVLPTA